MGTIACSLGPLVIHWYGLIMAFAIGVGLLVSLWRTTSQGKSRRTTLLLALFCIPGGMITARIYYVIANWDLYANAPGEIFFIWHGGLAIHGALIGVMITVYLFAYFNKLSFWYWLDILAPGFAIGQAIGQWGNFVNQQAFGYPTDAWWGIYIDFAYRPLGYEQYDYFHPTFLYESGWILLVFLALLMVNYLQDKYRGINQGNIFLLYVLLDSLGRFFIEGIRLDSEMIASFRLAQVVSLAGILITLFLLVSRNHCTPWNVKCNKDRSIAK